MLSGDVKRAFRCLVVLATAGGLTACETLTADSAAGEALTQLATYEREINRKIAAVKKGIETDHTRTGLQIARLNGNEARAAEFELALDQMLHPEKYVPEGSIDPTRGIERARQFRQE